ncbi:MAG: murein biosynthesis integral membrane protein MurJ [Desulfatirhabdiaceae bacterium]
MTLSLGKKVGMASLILMISVFLSRVLGLVREMVIAWIGGVGPEVDAYQIAFIIPEILNHAAGSGFLSITFIPLFAACLTRQDEKTGWDIFSIILNSFGTLVLVACCLCWIMAPELISILAPGLHDSEVRTSAIHMTRIMIPAQFFFFCGGLLTAVQFAKERFVFPALAPLIYNAGIILGGIVLGPWLGMEGFSWGVLAGAFTGNFLLQIKGAQTAGMVYQVKSGFTHPALKQYVKATVPLILGMGMSFSTEIFLKFFGSWLPAGSIASLNYSLRVVYMLVGVFGQAVGMASFPYMARLAAQNQLIEMNRLLNTAIRYLCLIIPVSVLLMALRHEIVFLLFQRGKFDAAAAALTSQVLLFMLIGAFAFSIQTVVVRGYYAVQNTLTPTLFSTGCALFSIPLFLLGMRFMGVFGVSLSLSLSAIFQVGILYFMWNKTSGNRESRDVWLFFLKMAGLSIPLGFFLEWARRIAISLFDFSGIGGNLILILLISLMFFLLMTVAVTVLKISEITGLVMRILNRVRKAK